MGKIANGTPGRDPILSRQTLILQGEQTVILQSLLRGALKLPHHEEYCRCGRIGSEITEELNLPHASELTWRRNGEFRPLQCWMKCVWRCETFSFGIFFVGLQHWAGRAVQVPLQFSSVSSWPQTLLDLCLNPIAGTKATLLASARVTQLELAIPCRGGWKAWVKIAVEKSPPGRVSKIPLSRDKSFCMGTVIPQTFKLWRGFKLSNFLR